MADPLLSIHQESNLSVLNRKIIEIKKKIQLSEGQRKANFEECDAKIRESTDKITNLKKDIKSLQHKYSRIKNNEDVAEKIAPTSRESSACIKKGGIKEAISRVDEDNIRLRKKLDLIKYKSVKQQEILTQLLKEYTELMDGRAQKLMEKKLEHPLKKKIVSLENQLHRVSVMQMEADTVRKKYRSVRATLKSDAAFYVSSLQKLEQSVKEQDAEIKQLQQVKEEAVGLRDITKETLMHQQIEAMNKSKERDNIILDYRQRVENRKLELERIERMIFPAPRIAPRDDFEVIEKPTELSEDGSVETPKDEMTFLEESFAKLRGATGVTKTEEVLDRFLSQKSTKDKLQKMRTNMEEEKMNLEKRRQQLTGEIELQKFSETKDADQNAEKLAQLNARIKEEEDRQNRANVDIQRIEDVINEVSRTLWKFCDKLQDVSETPVPPEPNGDPFELLELLEEKMKAAISMLGGPDQYAKWIEEITTDKFSTLSVSSDAGEKKQDIDERPLFPRFPGTPTPAAPPVPSDDEEEVPTRSVLKRQAQLLIDTKSRRKGFNFRR
ncbi:golgin subfamily A member 6-like protein 6 [Chelonus insularis]|uniref:golgin subfamily A member 6-like protein 6 n=1 Tax=Chelonus insularis TaxID=460826 RepID=UPI00158F5EF3|nr:golgin subfamily A member 6-like protein 6 [Chelonus insularis]